VFRNVYGHFFLADEMNKKDMEKTGKGIKMI